MRGRESDLAERRVEKRVLAFLRESKDFALSADKARSLNPLSLSLSLARSVHFSVHTDDDDDLPTRASLQKR